MNALAQLGRFGIFVHTLVIASLTHPPPLARALEEAYKIGVKSLPILLIISTFVGTNLSLQGYNAFLPMGGQHLVGMFVALAGVRELAPLMVAAMVAAKAGTEMASQIAVMRIREEIDALEVMAISPHWYLITPRIMGILLVLPALTMVCIFTLFVAAYAVAVVQLGLNGHEFIHFAAASTTGAHIFYTLVKAFCFGLIICLCACFFGFESKPGPRGVGNATNSAVVSAAVACACINYFLSEILYG
jgi:phospholipid/cholesterol/gamma-HCH transport system permease protein